MNTATRKDVEFTSGPGAFQRIERPPQASEVAPQNVWQRLRALFGRTKEAELFPDPLRRVRKYQGPNALVTVSFEEHSPGVATLLVRYQPQQGEGYIASPKGKVFSFDQARTIAQTLDNLNPNDVVRHFTCGKNEDGEETVYLGLQRMGILF